MAQYEIDNLPTPIDFSEGDFISRTLRNAKNLLMCRLGEVPFDRCRGFNGVLFDLPIEQLREELLPELDRCMLWEPDVEVVDATAELLPDGSTHITVVVEIDIDETAPEGDED